MHTGLQWKRWPNRKKSQDHKHRSKRERAKVGFSAWALLGLPSGRRQTCVVELPQERRFRIVTPSLYAGKTRWWCMKNPVTGRARQVVAIRSSASVWNCPCTKKRSLEVGGCYSRWSLKPGFTVPIQAATLCMTCTFYLSSQIPTQSMGQLNLVSIQARRWLRGERKLLHSR